MFWDKVTSRGPSGWHTSTITMPCDSKVRGKGNLAKNAIKDLKKELDQLQKENEKLWEMLNRMPHRE